MLALSVLIFQDVTDGGTQGGDILIDILKFGITPVIVVVLLLSKRLWTAGAYDAQVQRATTAESRADRNEAKVDEMVKMFREEVTPALVQATTTNVEAQRLMQRLADRLV